MLLFPILVSICHQPHEKVVGICVFFCFVLRGLKCCDETPPAAERERGLCWVGTGQRQRGFETDRINMAHLHRGWLET